MVDGVTGGGETSTSTEVSLCPICKKPAEKKCSGCYQVSYCSPEHQKGHWKSHKTSCKMFMIKRNDLYGRYLVATRDIPQGTIIFTEEPLTYGPKRSTYPVCLGCYKRVDGSYRCSKCTYPMCSEDCEKLPIHAENECLIFQKGTHPVGAKISNFNALSPAYESITPLRCLLLKKREPHKWEKLLTMEHHNELRKTVPGLWNRNQVNVVKLLMEWYKLKDDEELQVDEETIHSIMGFIDVNCFEIKFQDIEICGVYRDGGLMCHDCVPNTHHAISVIPGDHKMIVRSSIPIKKGEMITTSYASQLTGTRERRWFLKDTKYFDCLCTRCQDPTEFATYISGVKCPDCTTGYLLPKQVLSSNTEWFCTNTSSEDRANNNSEPSPRISNSSRFCTKTLKEEQIQGILKKAKKEIDEVSSSTAGSPISRLERLLKKYSGKVLHPNHFLLLEVIKSLNYAYAKLMQNDGIKPKLLTPATAEVEDRGGAAGTQELNMDHPQRAKGLCTQLLSVLDMIDPGLTRLRGVTLFQLSLADFRIAQTKFQRNEIHPKDYKGRLDNILVYLNTSKEILHLDTYVTPNAVVYGRILDQTESIKALIKSLDSSSGSEKKKD